MLPRTTRPVLHRLLRALRRHQEGRLPRAPPGRPAPARKAPETTRHVEDTLSFFLFPIRATPRLASRCFSSPSSRASLPPFVIIIIIIIIITDTKRPQRPIAPQAAGDAAAIADRFCEAAKRYHFALVAAPCDAPFAPEPPDAEFVVVDIFDGASGAQRRLVYVRPGPSAPRVPLNFGREVLADALGQPHKAHWKACELARHEEEQLCGKFKDIFAPFDTVSPTE